MTMTTHRQSKQGLQQPGSISSTRQYGLLGTLPYDVVTMVFAFLNQNDCLNCMALNREWYNLVPDCSKSVWKTVVFCGRDIHIQPHSRRAQCLGKHVRHIQLDMTLDEQEDIFYELVKKLLDWGCNEIESLGIVFFFPQKKIKMNGINNDLKR
ncbi:hypothetical protein BDA99DRAFT_206414 [Phascolomyces articulosus]|uniref:F-box domain-containing protein n=1 Tax=Phascolomyces articulosus TaxID=60185 RepID=A0AAD5JRI6_9FUNG|nr:hypothetical protein BDA99DRAFT_206414 [Phascolomyces articulosus]